MLIMHFNLLMDILWISLDIVIALFCFLFSSCYFATALSNRKNSNYELPTCQVKRLAAQHPKISGRETGHLMALILAVSIG